MASSAQKEAARENVPHAQAVWKGMSFHKRAVTQSEGLNRAKPDIKGRSHYYRIVVRPKEQFTSFRTQDIGNPGGLQRLAGRRSSGSWATQAWLVNKDSAHVEGKKLIADNKDVQDLIRQLGSQPILEKGDIFTAKDRPNVAEKDKSTPAMNRAQQENPSRTPQ
jgi:hypothetical protein